MNRIPRAFFLALIFSNIFVLGCARGRRLQLITISPVSADAENYPHDQVRFVATGVFNRAPLAITPLPVTWKNGFALNAPGNNGISIDGKGVAHCNPGFEGAASVMAFAPADPRLPLTQMRSSTQTVTASAQLICP